MQILSHRGYHLREPENSLASFQSAMALGVDGIETDIRLTADQALVLFHDHLTPDGRDVATLTHRELNIAAGHSIPTLDEALHLECDRHMEFLWNLEIKAPAVADGLLKVIQRHRANWRFLITSFCHPVIETVSRQCDAECGLLLAHRPVSFESRPDWVPRSPRITTLVWYSETVDADLLNNSRQCGLRNFVYGPQTSVEHQRLAAMAVDGIITDRPEFLIGSDSGEIVKQPKS
jgi:glycerophosphoryl diester phosphodiesterase